MFCCTNKRLMFLAIFGLAAVLGLAYLFRWQIVLGYAPFLFILLCPLMHLFGGHGTSHKCDVPRGHNHGADHEPPKMDKEKLSCH